MSFSKKWTKKQSNGNNYCSIVGTELREKNKDIKYLECELDAYKRKYEGINESYERAEN